MAACGSLQHIFENPLPESPTLLESLSSSWNQIKPPIKPITDPSSFTEIFGELHFKENSPPPHHPTSSVSSFPIIDHLNNPQNTAPFKLSNYENRTSTSLPSPPKINKYPTNGHSKCESFSLNSDSLQLCTEGLGFESSDDVEDMKNEMKEDCWRSKEEKATSTVNNTTAKHTTTAAAAAAENLCGELRRSRGSSSGGAFPPPISCIGKSGKPWVCFKSYRQDGRFVLKEVRIPTQEFLHACREDGRLKLHFVQPDDDILEEEEEEEMEEEEVEDVFNQEGLINDDIDGESKELIRQAN